MRGAKAKLIRSYTIGDFALKSFEVRKQDRNGKIIVNTGRRRNYQAIKKVYKQQPWNLRDAFI